MWTEISRSGSYPVMPLETAIMFAHGNNIYVTTIPWLVVILKDLNFRFSDSSFYNICVLKYMKNCSCKKCICTQILVMSTSGWTFYLLCMHKTCTMINFRVWIFAFPRSNNCLFKKNLFLFIWLFWVLVAACRTFDLHYNMQDLSCCMWTLSCACGIYRDGIWAPCPGSIKSYPLNHQGNPNNNMFFFCLAS